MLVILVVFSAALAGVSTLLYPSPYAPLFVLGGLVGLYLLVTWVSQPVWALYIALVLVFLPIGLIPPNIQSMLNRSMTVIAACVWGMRLLVTRKKIVWTSPALLMLLFLLWSSITLLWAERMGVATRALQVYSLRFLLFLLLIPNQIRKREDLEGLMKTLAASGWILMLSVIGTVLVEGYTAGTRLKIFGQNENGTGLLGLVALVGVLWVGLQPSARYGKAKILATAVYISLTVALVAMSGSRGGAISVAVTLAAFWFWRALRNWGKFGLVIAILALIFTPALFTTLFERFAVQRGDTPLGGREVLWGAAWKLIEDHPLGGVGIGNAPYFSIGFLETRLSAVGPRGAPLHNPILSIWSETAIPGILLYVGVLASALSAFVSAYLRFRRLGHDALMPYFAAVSCVTVGYMLSWVKGGGMESDFGYFLILALLTLPSVLDASSFESRKPVLQPSVSRMGP